MKTLNIILWVIVLLVGFNALLFFWRGLDIVINHDGLLRLLWIFKMATYTGIIALIYYVFRIRQGLFDQEGTKVIGRIRVLCGIAILTALFNSLANAGLETRADLVRQNLTGWKEAKGRFLLHTLEQLLDVHLLIYILIVSVFLLAGFVKLAAQLKSENESFI